MEVDLGDRGRAVERLIARVLEQELGDRDVLAGNDAQRAGGDTRFEVARQACGEVGAAAALDAVERPAGAGGRRRRHPSPTAAGLA